MDNFEKDINYEFKDKSLLTVALTHSSYANEKRRYNVKSNERLEFLGDSVLSVIVSKYIFEEYRSFPEGNLSKLRASVVCEKSLAKLARKLNLGDHLLLGNGEERNGGRNRDSVLSDAFEAVLAAIYLDSDLETSTGWLLSIMASVIKNEAEGKVIEDYKTMLQEKMRKSPNDDLDYRLVKEEGPDHDKTFSVKLYHNGKLIGEGSGKNKKNAEQNAAKYAYERL